LGQPHLGTEEDLSATLGGVIVAAVTPRRQDGREVDIDVINNGKFVYATKPGVVKAHFTFRDEQWGGEDSFYYVRVIQTDKNMAWASPIWVRRKT
jgi:hypothetical protein